MAANYDRDYGQNNGSLEQGGGNSSSRDIVSGSSSGFVNRGLQRWEESRAQWLASCAANKLEKRPQPKDVDIDQVIERIFSPDSDGELPHAIPLPQLIDLMTDLWEADGLFD